MKNKVVFLLAAAVAAAFYFGFLRLKAPSMTQVEKALPVQVDSKSERKLVEFKDKTQRAITAAKKELKNKKKDPQP